MEEVWVESRGQGHTALASVDTGHGRCMSLLLTDLALTIRHTSSLRSDSQHLLLSLNTKRKAECCHFPLKKIKNRREELHGNHYTRAALCRSIL